MKSRKFVLLFLFIVGLLMSALYAKTSLYDGDTRQLFERIEKFQKTGELLPYGNVASSGVKVYTPGSFLSVMTVLPFQVWNSPFSPLILLGFLHVLSLLLITSVLNEVKGPSMVLLFLVFYWCSPWRSSEVFLWNPGYLFLFTSLHFWSSYRLSKNCNFWPSFWHVLSIGGAFQCHSSFVILVILSGFLYWKKIIRWNWWGVSFGGLTVFLSLTPYLLFRASGALSSQESLQNDGGFLLRGIVYVYPFLKGIWYWVRQGSTAFQTHLNIVSETPGFLYYFWMFIVGIVSILTVGYSMISNYHYFKMKPWRDPSEWIYKYIFFAFVSLLIVSAIIPAEMAYWHVLLLFPIALLVPLLRFHKYILTNEKNFMKGQYIVGTLLLYFVVFTVISSLSSQKHRWPGNLKENYIEKHTRGDTL